MMHGLCSVGRVTPYILLHNSVQREGQSTGEVEWCLSNRSKCVDLGHNQSKQCLVLQCMATMVNLQHLSKQRFVRVDSSILVYGKRDCHAIA